MNTIPSQTSIVLERLLVSALAFNQINVTYFARSEVLQFRKSIDISLPPAKEQDDCEIIVMNLSEDRGLFVTEFAVLLGSISRRAPKYDAIFRNCYWYTGAVCDCVRREYPYSLKRDSRRLTIRGFPLGAKLTPLSI
jgi:hypothetical protein